MPANKSPSRSPLKEVTKNLPDEESDKKPSLAQVSFAQRDSTPPVFDENLGQLLHSFSLDAPGQADQNMHNVFSHADILSGFNAGVDVHLNVVACEGADLEGSYSFEFVQCSEGDSDIDNDFTVGVRWSGIHD